MRATLETGFVLILGATLVACGGGSSPSGPSPSLSAVGRRDSYAALSSAT